MIVILLKLCIFISFLWILINPCLMTGVVFALTIIITFMIWKKYCYEPKIDTNRNGLGGKG